MEFKRTIKCSNCGTETTLYMSSDLSLSELLVHGKCNSCGNTLQINYNLVGEAPAADSGEAQEPSSEDSSGGVLSTGMFDAPSEPESSDGDNTSETIRDLIED